jgi:hypothetical protein
MTSVRVSSASGGIFVRAKRVRPLICCFWKPGGVWLPEDRGSGSAFAGNLRGLVGKVHIFRRSGFTKTLLCIPVMSPLHSSELLV